MRIQIYQLVLIASVVFLYISGCKESPTQNYYNINIVDSLSNPDVNPRVIFTNPADGSSGPYGNTDPTLYSRYPLITIQFNKLINIQNYGVNSISLRTEDGDCPISLSTDYNNYFSNILVFDVQERYLASKTYTLVIDSTFTDVHGKKLSKPFTADFVPEPKFRVSYVHPTENDIEPSEVYGISLLFNSKVDETIFNSLSISPNIDGYWSLNSDYYYPDSLSAFFNITDILAYNTEYTITLGANAKDRNGLPIDKSYEFSFKTAPFRVNIYSYSQYIGPEGFSVLNDFYFRFNEAVDTSTVRNSISVSPPISYNIWFPYGGNNYYLELQFDDQEFQSNTEYTIHFSSTIKSVNGNALEEYNYVFTTGH